MSAGMKVADAIPDSVVEYFSQHPRALCVLTGALLAVSIGLMLTADELDVRANQYRRAYVGELQRAVSESLGG